MQPDPIIDPNIFSNFIIDDFLYSKPFPHLRIDNFLNADFAEQLYNSFPPIESMSVKYDGLNEKKSEDSSFTKFDQKFTLLKNRLMSEDFIHQISKLTGIHNLKVFDDRYGRGLHQGANESFLDIHIDYNIHPLEKKQRRINLLIFLNKRWESEWGGNLEFWNSDVTKCELKIAPVFNRCVIFECSDISYHGYSLISCPENITRKSLYLYFFSDIQKKLSFHDTVFKPLPNDSSSKKIFTRFKEFSKNTIKKILYYTGLNQLLK